jgi:copper chaperone CopZ
VRSALLDVPGVTRAQVSLETGEAVVTYDPRTTTVDSLVAVVNKTEAPVAGVTYNATVKVAPRAASTP